MEYWNEIEQDDRPSYFRRIKLRGRKEREEQKNKKKDRRRRKE